MFASADKSVHRAPRHGGARPESLSAPSSQGTAERARLSYRLFDRTRPKCADRQAELLKRSQRPLRDKRQRAPRRGWEKPHDVLPRPTRQRLQARHRASTRARLGAERRRRGPSARRSRQARLVARAPPALREGQVVLGVPIRRWRVVRRRDALVPRGRRDRRLIVTLNRTNRTLGGVVASPRRTARRSRRRSPRRCVVSRVGARRVQTSAGRDGC